MGRAIILFFWLIPFAVSAQFSADTALKYKVSVTGEGSVEVLADTITAYMKIKGNIYDKNYQQALDALCEKMLTELKVKRAAQMVSKDDEAPPRFSRKYNLHFSSSAEYLAFKEAAARYALANSLEINTKVRHFGLKPSTLAAAKDKAYIMALEDAKAKSAAIAKIYGIKIDRVLSINENRAPELPGLSHSLKTPDQAAKDEAAALELWSYYESLQEKKKKYKGKHVFLFSTQVHVVYSLK